MKIKNWLTAAALCLASLPGYAGVIYEWHAIKDESPRNFRLTLEFDEATVQKGSIDVTLSNAAMGSGFAIPDSGLLALRFWLSEQHYPPAIEYLPRVPTAGGIGDKYVTMKLNFLADGTLSGNIYAYNYMNQFTIASLGNVFTVFNVNSDAPISNCGDPRVFQCGGATGQLKLRQVPEPAPLALLAIGCVAALGRKRRHARA